MTQLLASHYEYRNAFYSRYPDEQAWRPAAEQRVWGNRYGGGDNGNHGNYGNNGNGGAYSRYENRGQNGNEMYGLRVTTPNSHGSHGNYGNYGNYGNNGNSGGFSSYINAGQNGNRRARYYSN